MWRAVWIHWQCSNWGGGSFLKIYEWVKCIWPMWAQQLHPSCTTVGGLPILQDWLNKMKLVHDRTIPIILPSGKNILADTMFKIIIWYTNLGTRQIQWRHGSRVCLFVAHNANLAGYPSTNNVFLGKKTHFPITIPIRGCSNFIWCKSCRHESESLKTMNSDAIESLICSRL